MTIKDFDFATSGRILFGRGKLDFLSEVIKYYGKKALVIKGKKFPNADKLLEILHRAGKNIQIFVVQHEPDIDLIEQSIREARKSQCDFVVGFGGGAVVDAGKAVSALLNNPGNLMDYLEVVGKGERLRNPSLPYIAIPTTAGTGSEVTRNAVIRVPKSRVKVSLRHPYLLPSIAIVDPELTLSVPPSVTASTGMDAFTQVIEPYVTKATNPVVDMFCREGIPLGAKNLLSAYENGADLEARENMAYVSLLGGLSLANAKLGAVHGFAGPIGGMFNAPHGTICAALLPAVMQVNAELISKIDAEEKKVNRFKEIAEWITGDKAATIQDGVEWISSLAASLDIPGLSELGISSSDFDSIIDKSKRSSSMKGNPVTLSDDQMERILEMSM